MVEGYPFNPASQPQGHVPSLAHGPKTDSPCHNPEAHIGERLINQCMNARVWALNYLPASLETLEVA
jgi:hypothetical protein